MLRSQATHARASPTRRPKGMHRPGLPTEARDHRLAKHLGQGEQGALIEFLDAAGDRAEHVAFGSLSPAYVLLVMGEGVDRLHHAPGRTTPRRYA